MIRRTKAAGMVGAAALGLGFVSMGGPAAGVTAAPARAQAYIRADTGLATFNPDVDPGSNCATPDQSDIQPLSDPGSTARNVHVDACLFSSGAAAGATQSDVDGPATFEAFGVGGFSACPDPDGPNGPKTSVAHDHNGDGRNEHCHQSGYQMTAAAGNLEFHARVNNSAPPGQTRVLFCHDPDQDGCLDERVLSQVAIGWTPAPQNGTAG